MINKVINQDLYENIHKHMPIMCVDIVLKTNNKQFLMVKRNTDPAIDKWWLVGGRVLKNESLEQAVKRKTLEEIGITISEVEEIVSGYEIMFKEDPYNHGTGTHNIVTCYLSYLININNIKLDKYHKEYKLFKYICNEWHPYLKECLTIAGFSENNN